FRLDLDRDDTAFTDIFEISQARLFDHASFGAEDDVELVAKGFFIGLLYLNPDGGGNFFVTPEFQEIGDRTPLTGAGSFRNLIDPFNITSPALSKEHQVIMRGRCEE